METTVNKFLTNMFLSGIVTQKDGVNYMWHNPFIFIPSRSFALFYNSLIDEIGFDKVDEIFYWLGLLQGRNSTKMIKNRFGFKKEDFGSFLGGADTIGMGNLEIVNIAKDYLSASIKGTNSTLALNYYSLNKKNKFPVDSYVRGILAGGCEILLGYPCSCLEKDCIAKGDDACIYQLKGRDKLNLKFLNTQIKDISKIEEAISRIYLTKKAFVSISLSKKFTLKNGAFFLNNIEGFDFEVYLIILLNNILLNYKQAYTKSLEVMFKDSLNILFKERINRLDSGSLQDVLNRTQIFGYGDIKIKNFIKNKFFLECKNSSFSTEYLNIFGKSKVCVDYFLEIFLKSLFLHVFNKKCNIKELNCISKGNSSCLFEVSI